MGIAQSSESGEHLLRTVEKGRNIWNGKEADEGYFDLLKSAVEAEGVDINYRDRDGVTALMIAVVRGDSETVKYLLSKGANANIIIYNDNRNTDTVLIISLQRSFVPSLRVVYSKITKLLIDGGADVNLVIT